MESKIYKKSLGAHIVSAVKGFMLFMFILCFFSIVTTGNFTMAVALFNPVVFGVIVYEVMCSPTVTVRADGIVYKHKGKSRTLGFETYYFSSDSQAGICAEDRRSHRTETLKFGGFDKKTLNEISNDIQKRQTAYYLRRNAAGEYKSETILKEDKSDMTSPETVKAPEPEVKYAELKTEMPAVKIEIEAPYSDDDADEIYSKGIPADYNQLPEISKIDESVLRIDYKSEPIELREEAPKSKVTAPELGKIEFRYPKRDIVERAERSNVLTSLIIMAAAVFVFLLWYLGFGYALNGMDILLAALGTMAVSAVVIAIMLFYRSSKIRGVFAKLEITETHLIVDNKRYKFDSIGSKSMTPPTQSAGERYLRFTYDGKPYVFCLGVCTKPSGKRELRYFTRYSELAKLLRERGFVFR